MRLRTTQDAHLRIARCKFYHCCGCLQTPLHTSAHSPGRCLRIVFFLSSFVFFSLSGSLHQARNYNDKIPIDPNQKEPNIASFHSLTAPLVRVRGEPKTSRGAPKRFLKKQVPPIWKFCYPLCNIPILYYTTLSPSHLGLCNTGRDIITLFLPENHLPKHNNKWRRLT